MNPSPPGFVSIRLDSFSPSFIGEDLFQPSFIIGSDNGVLAFTNEVGNEIQERCPVSPSGEAINGVAGFGDLLAVSTGDEVTIVSMSQNRAKVIEHGAHGVVALGEKRFLAPLGHEGILVVTPTEGSIADNDIVCPETPLNFYQLCPLPTPFDNRCYLVAACRTGGIRVVNISFTSSEIGVSGGPFADVIDVAYLGNKAYPFAVGAVGIGGEIFLCRDIVHQEPPVTLHYQNFTGRVYRILASHEHLFILTSKAIYVLGNLVKRLTQPVFDGSSRHPFMTIPMNAVDVAIVDDKWLMPVMSDSIRRYGLDEIDQKIDEFIRNGSVPQPGLDLLPFPVQAATQPWMQRVPSHVG